MLGTTLEGLGGLPPDGAAAGGTSGRKQKAYGARGKAERKDARRQARKRDQQQHQQAAVAIKNKKQQQQQEEEEEKQDTPKDSVGKKAGRSKSSGGRTTTSTLEALATSSAPAQAAAAAASPKRSSSHRQPSTKSAKSRGRAIEEDEVEEVEEETMDDAHSNWTEEFESDSEESDSEESDMETDQQKQRIQPAAKGDDCDAGITNTGSCNDGDNINDDDGEEVDRSTDGDIGSPPILRTRTKPYARGRNKRTIEEESDEDDNESSDEGEEVQADSADGRSNDDHGDAPIMSEENETDGSVVLHRDDDDDREQEEDQSHAQATLGGILAAAPTPAASTRGAPVLTSPHRRAASAAGGASACRPRSSSRGSRHSHDAGGALALMQVQRYPEQEMANEDGEKKDEDKEEVGGDARGRASQDSFFSSKSDEITDPDGGSANDELLTQGSYITDDHNSQTKRPGTSKQRVVESPYSTNSRLSDAETFQASTGSSNGKKKKKETASMKKKKVRHYNSDDDYEAEEIERSDQRGDKSGSGAGDQDRTNKRRRRSSRQKQRENSAWYNRGAETDDDEENEFTDDADDNGDNVNDGTTSSDESDDELGGGRNGPKDSPPKLVGKKRRETSVTPKADNRSLTQLGRNAKMKKKREKSSSSASSSMNLHANANADNEDSLSFYSQSLPEVHVAKQPIVIVSKRSRGASGTKKKKVNREPTTSGCTKTSDTVDDPFMDGDPSVDAEKQDPIDEFDESQGIGFSDDNDPPSASGMENAKVLADNAAIAAKSPPADKLGEAGRKSHQRLGNGAPFSSPSVLETKLKVHEPTIKWADGLDRDADADADADDTKASSVEMKGRSARRARASDSGLVDSILAGHGQHHSPAVHQEDEDSDVGDDDDVGLDELITQPKEHRDGTSMSSSGSEGDNDDSEYQDSQLVKKSGQQQPRQKRQRMVGKATEEASALMTTAANISDSTSPAGRGKHRTPTKRVLVTITTRLRSLSRKTSQEEKDITDALKEQADLYNELQEMRSSLQPPNQLSSLLKSTESETETTVSTFSSSLNSILSAAATMDGKKIGAEGRRKRLSALCSCLRFFVGVPDGTSTGTDIFNSFSRYGIDRKGPLVLSEDMREVLSKPKILSRLLIAVQCQESIQKRSRPNEVEKSLRSQASYLSCACLSLVDPSPAIEQIISSASSRGSDSTSLSNAVGDLHKLAASLSTMDSYPKVELSLLFLVRVRKLLLASSLDGAEVHRQEVANATLKKLDKSFPSVYRKKISRLNMHALSEMGEGDGLSFCSWARECTKQGNGHARTFGCKVVFNPKNNDGDFGPRLQVVDCVHINRSSLSFFLDGAGNRDEVDTLRTTDSSITENDTDGENTAATTSSSLRARLSVEHLYGTTKLVEMHFEDWEDQGGDLAVDRPVAYLGEAGAITIYLSSDGMRRSNLSQALDDTPESNIVHIEIKKSEFVGFCDLLAARGVETIDHQTQEGQLGSQSSVTTAPYNGEEDSNVFAQVEFNTSKIRGAPLLDINEDSDNDAALGDGVEDELVLEDERDTSTAMATARDGDSRAEKDDESVESHWKASPDEDRASSRHKSSRLTKGTNGVDMAKPAAAPKRKGSSLGKRKAIDDENPAIEDNGNGVEGTGTAATKQGARRKHTKTARATAATKKQHQMQQRQIANAQTREVTPLPESSNAHARQDKQTSTSPLPHQSAHTNGTSQNLDTSFARVEQSMKKPLASISASCCAMSVVGRSSTAFNIKHAASDDLAKDVIAYDVALGQAVAALSHVRHLGKKIEDGCKFNTASLCFTGNEMDEESSPSPSAFGWIDEPYNEVVEKQKEWIQKRESVEKELSGILLNGLLPASKDQNTKK